ncbi:MAG: non-ribosomal peptide synthetase, partial [Bacteroidota bacterium]
IKYSTACFQDAFLKRAERHLNQLLTVLDNMSGFIADMEILPAEETSMLEAFNRTEMEYPDAGTVVDMIRKAARQTPDALAVSFQSESITYGELDKKTDALAAYLLDNTGLAKGDVVSIIADRSANFIIAILGIIKSGGAYLPIDPGYPKERIEYMLSKSESKALMADSSLLFEFDTFEGELFALDLQLEMLEEQQVDIPLSPGDLAYVIFTSGSTGKPKGVMVEHGALMNLVNWHCRSFAVSQESRATAIASTAFDASVWELWPYLAAGAHLFPVEDSVRMNPKELAEFLNKNGITHTFLPTPMLMEFANQGWSINKETYVLTGGDELKFTSANLHRVVNNYGPSESAVVTTSVSIEELSLDADIPIGKPIDNIKTFIMDKDLRQVPVGLIGEIYIAGAGLARGYINDDALTREKFSALADGTRVYATGDMGVWREDGQILFKGRNDSQVKIRGNRIELEEVRKRLLTDPRITDALVLKRSEQKGGDQLVCFYQSDQQLSENAQVGILEGKLPDYMIPTVGLQVSDFPVNRNGKIDRKKLLLLIEESITDESQEELSEALRKMTAIWNEALEQKGIKSNDNFFSVGGDSIKAIRLVYAVNEGFDCDLKLMDIFKNDTPAKLLQFLDVQVVGGQG